MHVYICTSTREKKLIKKKLNERKEMNENELMQLNEPMKNVCTVMIHTRRIGLHLCHKSFPSETLHGINRWVEADDIDTAVVC